MTLNEALKRGHKVCVRFQNEDQEAGAFIVFNQIDNLTTFLTPIVGEVEFVGFDGDRGYDYQKTLHIYEIDPCGNVGEA